MDRREKLRDVGERRAIEILKNILDRGRGKNIVVGIGDDCAVIDMGNKYLLVTTDMISLETHIPIGTEPFQIGWYVVSVNLSDVAAKGGTPIGIVTALGLPRTTTIDFIEELADGMDSCAREFGLSVVGGDTKEAYSLTIAGAAFGTVSRKDIMLRTGTRMGDIVALTGSLGKAASGFYSIKHSLGLKNAEKALLEPYPRVREGIALAGTHAVTSCMDISDGLASSAYQMSLVTGLKFQIDWEKIPIAGEVHRVCRKCGIDEEELVLYYGGDFELLLTLKPEMFSLAQRTLEKIGTKLTKIGKVCRGQSNLLIRDGRKGRIRKRLENRGWEHFMK